MKPLRTIITAVRNSGHARCMEPVWNTRPYFACAAMTLRDSSTLKVSGFSQYTSLPCFMASTAM